MSPEKVAQLLGEELLVVQAIAQDVPIDDLIMQELDTGEPNPERADELSLLATRDETVQRCLVVLDTPITKELDDRDVSIEHVSELLEEARSQTVKARCRALIETLICAELAGEITKERTRELLDHAATERAVDLCIATLERPIIEEFERGGMTKERAVGCYDFAVSDALHAMIIRFLLQSA